jgi:D-alanyl-D-alanine dipeptidase
MLPKLPPRSSTGGSPIGGSSNAAKPGSGTAGKAAPKTDPLKLSGKHWCSQYPTSTSLDDLTPPFRDNMKSFVEMLRANGASVDIEATYRPKERAYLMHWAWMISHAQVKYGDYPKSDPYKIGIVWDHGDQPTSKAKASEMVKGYAIVSTMKQAPALDTRHTEGKAIDMYISNLPKTLTFTHNGKEIKEDVSESSSGEDNKALHRVGEKYFSVVKATFGGDPPHWSSDGH